MRACQRLHIFNLRCSVSFMFFHQYNCYNFSIFFCFTIASALGLDLLKSFFFHFLLRLFRSNIHLVKIYIYSWIYDRTTIKQLHTSIIIFLIIHFTAPQITITQIDADTIRRYDLIILFLLFFRVKEKKSIKFLFSVCRNSVVADLCSYFFFVASTSQPYRLFQLVGRALLHRSYTVSSRYLYNFI